MCCDTCLQEHRHKYNKHPHKKTKNIACVGVCACVCVDVCVDVCECMYARACNVIHTCTCSKFIQSLTVSHAHTCANTRMCICSPGTADASRDREAKSK